MSERTEEEYFDEYRDSKASTCELCSICVCVCFCVCVLEREGERERERDL